MKRSLFVLLLLLFFLSGCVSPSVTLISDEDSVRVSVEVADTLEERRVGLMHREFLDENKGMLFIFEDAQPRTFWMKNTLIPLDIIFISDDLQILNIAQAVPCREDPCVLYPSEGSARYVLEVNQGFIEKRGIIIGDKVQLNL